MWWPPASRSVIGDAREHKPTSGLASVKSGKVLAYAGLRLALPGSGRVLGTLCVADAKPRAWKPSELRRARGTRAVGDDGDRAARRRRGSGAATSSARTTACRGCWTSSPVAIYAKDLEGNLLSREEAPRAEGVTRRGRAVTFPCFDQAGEPYGDLRHRGRARRHRGRAGLRDAPTGMAMIGADGRFTQVNAALCELTGRSEAQLLRMTLAETIHPDEWAARKRLFERRLTGEIRTHQTQGRLLSATGSRAGCSSTPRR